MVVSNTGFINLVGSMLTHTLDGKCNGSIIQTNVTGGTAPYTVSWSGVSDFSATTFDIVNLCAGLYTATITDSNRVSGSTSLRVSGLTAPTVTATLSDTSCIDDPNGLGTISVTTSTTETSAYRYELRKDNKLIKTHYGTTGDTRHDFTNISNGMYTVSVIENRPTTITTRPVKTGCTFTSFSDGGQYSGLGVTDIFATWERYAPRAYGHIGFGSGIGPNGGASTIYYQSGLAPNGTFLTTNPYVWFYTGTTASRKTDSSKNWYLGASAFTSDEGGDYGPGYSLNNTTDVGYFYYNTFTEKFVIWWNSVGGASRWVTFDPRRNYGAYGNPVASSALTSTTYGLSVASLNSSDYTVNSAGNVQVATSVVTGDVNKLFYGSSANNGNYTGMLSYCSYNNYTWETTFRAASDNDTLGFILASFRDDYGKYGPSGVTHELSMYLNCASTPHVTIRNNGPSSAYGFHRSNNLLVQNCNGGCTNTTTDYGKTTVLKQGGTQIPFSGTAWNTQGSIRTKIVRHGQFGEFFNIQFTDTMGAAFGGGIRKGNGVANPYNSNYNISFNLLDKSTWSGNTESVLEWVDEFALCKYLGSQRIGYTQSSQPDLGFYHIQFSGSPIMEYIEAPKCGSDDGPTHTVEITATTGTTLNIEESKPCNAYYACNKGVPKIKPRVSAIYQNMPRPSVTVNGLTKPTVKVTSTVGNQPQLPVYNASESNEQTLEFYFGGENQEMTFNNSFVKFSVYPYVYQNDELSTIPDYEAFFDNLPNYIDRNTKGRVFSAQTNIPLSSLSTNIAWEYVVRPSFLFKQKTMLAKNTTINNDVWVDTANYPPSTKISAKKDLYMVVVQNPPTPQLEFKNFRYANSPNSALRTQREEVILIPDVTATTYSSFNYGVTLDTPAISDPLVSVNGLVVSRIGPVSGTTGQDYNNRTSYGDYYVMGNTIIFNTATVQKGDVIQIVYDAKGNSKYQSVLVPSSISTSSASTIFSANSYYYVNLETPSVGTVSVALNGAILIAEQDYRKVDESRIQLLKPSDYTENDVIALFYHTIYSVVGVSAQKNPEIPINYQKTHLLDEELIVRMFNDNGNVVTEITEKIKATFIGQVEKTVVLNPPEPGTYYYDVRIKRYYPLFNGEKIITEKATDLVEFKISRDVFYSPTGKVGLTSPYTNPFTGGTNEVIMNMNIGGRRPGTGSGGGGYSSSY